ncbi:DUF1998 domain-containing protein [Streptomyces capparidis]
MTPPPPPRRRRGAGAPIRPRPRKLGAVRRSQLVTTYGVGAMIAVDNESFMVADLDSWDISEASEIHERRLAHLLGVKSFRTPPAPDPDRGTDGVRVRRFPEYYSCPGCKALRPFFKFNSLSGKARCLECEEDLIPSRFVLVCDNGHIDDFPYWKWVHRGKDRPSGPCGGELSLRTSGNTASLRSVIVSCGCGVPEVSMEGAFRPTALRNLGIRCEGRRPWLKNAPNETCTQHPRAMQRGSSSAWHPIMASALSIPPWGEGLHKLLEKHRLIGASEETIRWFFQRQPGPARDLKTLGASVAEVIALARAVEESDTRTEEDVPEIRTHSSLRREEYTSLTREHPEEYTSEWQPFVCEEPAGDLTPVRELGVRSSMLVKRLREVRALASFSRGALPTEADSKKRRAALTSSPDIDWLPAIEVIGEGVFLRLDEDRLRGWESRPEVIARSERIRNNHLRLLRERTETDAARNGPPLTSPVSPRFLLLHALAHVLINEWSLDGGYPAAALRERLYAGDDMAGVLIYTATSDSAGSLGGIVAQGEPERLAHTLRSALLRASWCSNDPLCAESEARGVDSVNLAACHACVLLPETSCEWNNCFLDRALLVGSPTGAVPGYFVL